MRLSMMVQEKVETYETSYQLKNALDKILTGYDQFEQSNSLEEDIGYLSKKCTGYNQKSIIKLYQFLLDQGYFLDSKFLFRERTRLAMFSTNSSFIDLLSIKKNFLSPFSIIASNNFFRLDSP